MTKSNNSMDKFAEINLLRNANSAKDPVLPTTDYDPHQHGNQVHPITFWCTVFHLLKVAFGTGVLAMPFLFKNVGYVIGFLGLLLIAVLYIHVLHMLLTVEYRLCSQLKVPNLTYPGTIYHAFEMGPRSLLSARPFCTSLLYFQFIGNLSLVNAVGLLTISTNIKIVVDHLWNMNFNITAIVSAIIVPIILLTWIPRLKFLAPFSAIANVLNITNLLLIMYVSMSLGVDTSASVKPVGQVSKLPQFVAIAIGALTCTGMLLPLKNDMSKPKRFMDLCGTVNVTVGLTSIIYVIFGLVGYFSYGDNTEPNIMQNLPATHFASLFILTSYSFVLGVSFILNSYVSMDLIWMDYVEKKFKPNKHEQLIKCGIKTVHAMVSYTVVVALQSFEIVLYITGTVRIIVEVCIPTFLDTLLWFSSSEKSVKVYAIIFKNVLLIVLALLLFTFSLISVIYRVIEYYNGNESI